MERKVLMGDVIGLSDCPQKGPHPILSPKRGKGHSLRKSSVKCGISSIFSSTILHPGRPGSLPPSGKARMGAKRRLN